MSIVDDVKTMTDDELGWALSVISQEISARKELADIPRKIEGLNRDYLAATGITEGTDWVQPTGAHDAYPLDWVLKHEGKEWRSLIPSNVWEPGVSGWREVVPEPTPEPEAETPSPEPSYGDWVQPTGAHDAYEQGDVVLHDDQIWQSTANANVWAPGVYGWIVREA